ncbi:hypothetical protein LguiB_030911 [Lonicera macranthoides]
MPTKQAQRGGNGGSLVAMKDATFNEGSLNLPNASYIIQDLRTSVMRNKDIKEVENWHLWGKDERNGVHSRQISLSDLRFFHHLGASDIDSVFLVNLKSSALNDDALFDTKVMDKKELASHNKEGRESFVPAAIFMFSSGGPKIE